MPEFPKLIVDWSGSDGTLAATPIVKASHDTLARRVVLRKVGDEYVVHDQYFLYHEEISFPTSHEKDGIVPMKRKAGYYNHGCENGDYYRDFENAYRRWFIRAGTEMDMIFGYGTSKEKV